MEWQDDGEEDQGADVSPQPTTSSDQVAARLGNLTLQSNVAVHTVHEQHAAVPSFVGQSPLMAAKLTPLSFSPADIKVRLMPTAAGLGKLVRLPEFLAECKRRREQPPILTPTESVRKAQNLTSAYKSRAEDREISAGVIREAHAVELGRLHEEHAEKVRQLRRQLEEQEEALVHRICEMQQKHGEELEIVRVQERARAHKHLNAVKQWGWIQRKQVQQLSQDEMQQQQVRHKK